MSYVLDETIENMGDYREDEYVCICENCGEEYDEDEAAFFNDMCLCPDCIDNHTFICHHCGQRFWTDGAYHYDDNELCESCYDYYYTNCAECGRVIPNDNAYYLGDDDFNETPLCEWCHENKRHIHINDYGYKPDPIFYRSSGVSDKCSYEEGIYIGVELEIDDGGESDDNAKILLDIANEHDEHIYIKHDGSISDGFEIVTHPATLEYHQKNFPWRRILSSALSMGYKSHDASSSCGLHCHVGRSALGNTQIEQEDSIGRILFFVEKFWDEMLIISRRDENALAQWAARYDAKDNPKMTLIHAKNIYGRYKCINIQNSATIEFRLFRGTLKYSSFIATLQLVQAICSAAILMIDEDFQAMTWADFCTCIDETTMPELVQYLEDKNIYETENIGDREESA